MKLLTKYNRINLVSTVVIFLLASVAFALLLHYVLINQVDEDLKIEQNEITSYVNKYNKLPEVIKVRDQQIFYKPVEQSGVNDKRQFHNLKVYNDHHKEQELVRELNFNINAGGQWYIVTVRKSLEGTDDLVQSIIVITAITILLILMATFLINRIVLRRLWQPFYDTLQTVGSFKLGKNKLQLQVTNIDEFALMNKTLQQAITKAEEDYVLLKQFTENASHELQTPLAVIRSKLDLLIQDEYLTAGQSDAVQSAYDALQKLSRMNQSLLLLTKIENRQFSETEVIDMKALTETKLNQFKELWQNKNITVKHLLQRSSITFNPTLADILLNNLCSNATKHNIAGGSIDIELNAGSLTFRNTGPSVALCKNRVFTRFYKSGYAQDSYGLGLSIIKQICEVSSCNIAYSFEGSNTHVFSVNW
jgi:signal transduction histidine kinase